MVQWCPMALIMSITQIIQFCEIYCMRTTDCLAFLFVFGFFLIVLGFLTWSFTSRNKYLQTVLYFLMHIV